jgi:hypothetical protein
MGRHHAPAMAIAQKASQRLLADVECGRRLSAAEEARMDEDVRDLVVALCTRAGMLMEDASPVALGIASLDEE